MVQTCVISSLLNFYLQLIFQMPQSHRNVFTYISAFLRELLLHSNDNKLDAKTLGKLTFSMFLLSLTLTVDMVKKETNRATHTYALFVACARARTSSHL